MLHPRRVAGNGGVDSILQFWVEMEHNGIKCYRKMKRGGNELILTQWEGSVTRRGGVTTSARREATPEREKRGDDDSWAETNLTVLKK